MKFVKWIWQKGILGTFISGVFALLPIALTVGVIAWLSNWVVAIVGPTTLIGRGLKSLGLHFVTNETTATILGYVLVIVGIWTCGLLVKSKFKHVVRDVLDIPNRVPVVSSIYGTVSQVVQMLKKDEGDSMKGMQVVYCNWSDEKAGGFLALSPIGRYVMDKEPCRIVYIPTSPIPMSGGCVFWPDRLVKILGAMRPDEVMQIYLSLGVLAPQVIPKEFHHEPEPEQVES